MTINNYLNKQKNIRFSGANKSLFELFFKMQNVPIYNVPKFESMSVMYRAVDH